MTGRKDIFSKKKRSEVMSKIHSSNTKFEERFFVELKKKTAQEFKTNVKEIRGKPDIVFENKRLCVFLDSDFWHGWQYPRWKQVLKNDFWKNKIENNKKRDRKTTIYLRKHGWKVLRIWEHQINKKLDETINKIIENLF
jgi:DNA mismatch endonuclease (patch repair protein)